MSKQQERLKAERRAAICAELIHLIGAERKRRRVSKNRLAELTGLNQSTVSRLENYHENPTLDSLLRVSDALEINLGEVLSKAMEMVRTQTRTEASKK